MLPRMQILLIPLTSRRQYTFVCYLNNLKTILFVYYFHTAYKYTVCILDSVCCSCMLSPVVCSLYICNLDSVYCSCILSTVLGIRVWTRVYLAIILRLTCIFTWSAHVYLSHSTFYVFIIRNGNVSILAIFGYVK